MVKKLALVPQRALYCCTTGKLSFRSVVRSYFCGPGRDLSGRESDGIETGCNGLKALYLDG